MVRVSEVSLTEWLRANNFVKTFLLCLSQLSLFSFFAHNEIYLYKNIIRNNEYYTTDFLQILFHNLNPKQLLNTTKGEF